ncbi:MAG: 3-phosphoshikimate 1-carboxyvinyltransferase [Candidatus Margulisiibacteriota bacterium]
MADITVKKAKKIKGEMNIPGDKSISHRAVMLGALADGETTVNNFLNSADCLATAECLREMGIESTVNSQQLTVKGKGLRGLQKPGKELFVGNSGTTIRILSGILAGQNFPSKITGDASIQKRPMKRIVEPLTRMGAKIKGEFAPLEIQGGKLRAIEYKLPMASAQVKSCILLAGLFADGETTVIEPVKSRDHTERMLGYLGVDIKVFRNEITIRGNGRGFDAREINVPGDISSAAFFMAAGILVPDSDLLLRNVGTNPTRTGILEVFHRMGADLEVKDEEIMSGEPRGSMRTRHVTSIHGLQIGGELIPRLIDEIPIIAVVATQAEGDTVIKDAKELRVKESDRIATISAELRKMGVNIEEKEDGMVIHGPTPLKGCNVESHGDHRVAMSLAIAGFIAEGETRISNTDCIETSFPGFEKLLNGSITQ